MAASHLIREIYRKLDARFGDLHWWPGETPFEVIVGAILTQNTNWKNVERAIENLKKEKLLSPERLFETADDTLAELIRPSGYYRLKTRRLKAFLHFLFGACGGDVETMFAANHRVLRKKLLAVKGIGEETADSILLYAGGKPVFVVDVYTRRILQRHFLIQGGESYEEIQSLFMSHLPRKVPLFKQYHALLVNAGKHFCRKKPLCDACPLKGVEKS